MEDEPINLLKKIIAVFIGFVLIIFALALCTSLTACTLSFQNISTHGTATDLVDEQQAASPQVDAKVSAPLGAI